MLFACFVRKNKRNKSKKKKNFQTIVSKSGTDFQKPIKSFVNQNIANRETRHTIIPIFHLTFNEQ